MTSPGDEVRPLIAYAYWYKCPSLVPRFSLWVAHCKVETAGQISWQDLAIPWLSM